MRKMKKFADGGSTDRNKARYERKVADIESDYQGWLKSGRYKTPEIAKAKYEQRMADARDDLQKWTGGNRALSRAGEQEAEAALKAARRGTQTPQDARRTTVTATSANLKTPDTSASSAAPVKTSLSSEPTTLAEAFRAARKEKGPGKTFPWRGGLYTTDYASEAKKPASAARRSTPAPASTRRSTPAAVSAPSGSTPTPTPAPASRPAAPAPASRPAAPAPASRPAAPASPPANRPRGRVEIERARAVAEQQRRQREETERTARITAGSRAFEAKVKRGESLDIPSLLRAPGKAKGGKVKAKPAPKKYAKGGSVDGCAVRGKTKAMRKK